MKKTFYISLVFVLVTLCAACAKNRNNSADNSASIKDRYIETDSKVLDKKTAPVEDKKFQEPVKTAEELKLESVYAKMSSRFKGDVKITDEKAFIADLKTVLKTISNFSAEDLSPFYLIDKKHIVSENYVPKKLVHLENCEFYNVNKNNLSLRPEAVEALKTMGAAAKADGVTLTVSSTYRSYEYQKNLFDYWVRVDGLEEAERESARAGTSQHQLGLAMDFAPVDDAFAETKAGHWVYENAAKYGWSLSFPQQYEDVTGYRWESWHFRYVGIEAVQFQKKYFNNVQQYMIEFIDAWVQE